MMYDQLFPMAQLNLALGWIWIIGGFCSGALLGMGFHKSDFLGGYASFRRRLLRLGHIAFFGTGILNLLFVGTVILLGWDGPSAFAAGIAFALGALAMPLCCGLVAWKTALKPLFALPVISLMTAGILTCMEIL